MRELAGELVRKKKIEEERRKEKPKREREREKEMKKNIQSSIILIRGMNKFLFIYF